MKTPAKTTFTLPFLVLGIVSLLFLPATSHPQKNDYQNLKQEAERLYERGSFSRSHKLYLKAQTLDLEGDEGRWVAFRSLSQSW